MTSYTITLLKTPLAILLFSFFIFTSTANAINVVVQSQVASSVDNAEEKPSGTTYISSSDLELTMDRGVQQTVGIRFTGLAIPNNAAITRAYIQFQVDEITTGSTNLTIYGESSTNADLFSTTLFNVSSRLKTIASAIWSPPAWGTVGVAGEDQRTSDLTAIVQEIVSKAGWSEGNAMAFIITGSGERTSESYNGNQAGAPKLFVEYSTEPGTDTTPPVITVIGDNPIYLIVDDTYIDAGATAEDNVDGNITLSILVNDNVNTAVAGTYEVNYNVSDTAGNPAVASRTVIVTSGGSGIPQTIQAQVSVGTDDAEEKENGTTYLNSSDLELVYDRSLQTVGVRFVDLAIPQNATITKATIQFKTDETSTQSTVLTIQGEKTANANTFSATAQNISSRTKTTASVSWSPPAWNSIGEVGVNQRSADLTSIVQEIVTQVGWSTGNAMAFILTGTGERVAEAYEGDPTGAATLTVEYSTDISTVPPVITLIGANPLNLNIGQVFNDPGATAQDTSDGNLTASIQTSDNVNTAVAGTYQVTYTVTDSDENFAMVSRSVVVTAVSSGAKTLERSVSGASDDAEERVDGSMYLSSSDLELVFDKEIQTVGIRFSNLTIPQNAMITKAYIQFKVDETDFIADTLLNIYGEKSNSAQTFTKDMHNISSRMKTAKSVSWSPVRWSNVGEAGEDQRTPNLIFVLQEIISQSGWSEGNAMAFIITGEGKRVAESYNGDQAGAPKLYVEYTNGIVNKTVMVTPETKRMLPLSSTDFYVVDAPIKGTVEVKIEDTVQGTGTYVYVPYNGSIGQDSIKFRGNSSAPFDEVIINIEIQKIPITLNDVVQPDFSSNLPLLILDTNSKTIQDEPKIKGILTIISPDESGRSQLGILPEYSDYMEVELRGSTSLTFPKKGYGLDTEMIDGEDNDVSLFGMPKEHKWVLHGPYSDKSLMRNYIAYNKSRDTGGYAAVRTRYVEILIQEDDHYRYDGLYVFMEKIKRDGERVDIEKLKDTDISEPTISGGYIMKVDRVDDDDWYFETIVKAMDVIVEYPKAKDINAEQKVYIENYINSFEMALFSNDYNNQLSSNYYGKWINIDTFAKHLLSRELFRDTDSWKRSEFMQKDREKKLSMLPVWDFNLGMGNVSEGRSAAKTDGWHYERTPRALLYWMSQLMADSEFKKIVSQKWCSLRSGPWSDVKLDAFIDETKTLLSEAQERNFIRWPVLGVYVYDNRKACKDDDGTSIYCDTWEKAVEENMRVWLHGRTAWMDDNLLCEDRNTKKVMISEIHYNPLDKNDEFIELYNDENTQIVLDGWKFTSGIELTFVSDTNISAKGTLVIVKDSSKYPGSIQWSDGKLSNAGEKIELQDANGTMIDIVEYNDEDSWPISADGNGSSLQLNENSFTVDKNDYGENWHASSVNGGTPGVLP